MRVYPDDGHFAPGEPLTDRLGGSRYRADGDGMVPAEREDHFALACVLIDLVARPFRRRADGYRLLHAAVNRVICKTDVRIVVHGIVMADLVVQVVSELVKESG